MISAGNNLNHSERKTPNEERKARKISANGHQIQRDQMELGLNLTVIG